MMSYAYQHPLQPEGATKIALEFSAFDLEQNWDFLDVYDGSSTSAPRLFHLTGSSIPPPIVSTGPSMYLRFYTDIGVDSVGFTASYTALIPVVPSVTVTVTATVTVQVNNTIPPEDRPPHHFLFSFIGILIGIALSLGTFVGYQKWKEHNEMTETVRFEAVPQEPQTETGVTTNQDSFL